jgi:D-alanyl-D-alanine carboxypeptidase
VWALMAMVTSAAGAQELDAAMKAKVDAAVQRVMKADWAPSVSVAIVQGDRVAYAAAYGMASVERGERATTATRYQLASVSKTFTAQAVLLLQADGKLSLDDRVAKWFPKVTSAQAMTLRQVLSHTCGLPDDYYLMGYPAGERGRATTPDAIIAKWGSDAPVSAPGVGFHYSNLDYQIAGRVVEKVSGKPLWAFLQERICAGGHDAGDGPGCDSGWK